MLTVLEVVKKTSEFFAGKGIESPRLNAELIIGHALGLARMKLYLEFERPVTDPELAVIRELVRRRGRREPLQYVLGFADFCGLRLKADSRALIPRPETELLVETLVSRAAPSPARILDLGTGSGAIALALAKAFPDATVTAVDSSAPALALASENALGAGFSGRVQFILGSWFEKLPPGKSFDIVVSNPPYLSDEEVAEAAPEVREHEPAGALGSGSAGFADLAGIIAGSPAFLAPGGLLALETGIGHHAQAAQAAGSAGFARTESVRDLTGRDRIFLAWR
ncbi:MAG TPA: peptide chain release factor N(5)-glutamine methyltransferase [Opitutaceae bacterium]|jgi:release factor glutamine methyltransferase|nr:peptide chain release factor N(5)-glutamine methyltransferase [Opitutaceae bacterium]